MSASTILFVMFLVNIDALFYILFCPTNGNQPNSVILKKNNLSHDSSALGAHLPFKPDYQRGWNIETYVNK